MKYQNPFSYNIKMFLMGKKPILLSSGIETLIKAIEDPRVFVWQENNNGSIVTNIGALRLIHKTGEIHNISNYKTVLTIPENKRNAIFETINARIRKDENKIKFKKTRRKTLDFIKNLFTQRNK